MLCCLQVRHGVEQAHRGVKLAGPLQGPAAPQVSPYQCGGSTYKTFQRHPTDWTGGLGKALQGPCFLQVDMQPCLPDTLAALLTGNGELTNSASFSAYLWMPSIVLIATAKCIKYNLLLWPNSKPIKRTLRKTPAKKNLRWCTEIKVTPVQRSGFLGSLLWCWLVLSQEAHLKSSVLLSELRTLPWCLKTYCSLWMPWRSSKKLRIPDKKNETFLEGMKGEIPLTHEGRAGQSRLKQLFRP